MLIEANYRDEEIILSYNGKNFAVPNNLYIIGMMNTADKSLAVVDYALRTEDLAFLRLSQHLKW